MKRRGRILYCRHFIKLQLVKSVAMNWYCSTTKKEEQDQKNKDIRKRSTALTDFSRQIFYCFSNQESSWMISLHVIARIVQAWSNHKCIKKPEGANFGFLLVVCLLGSERSGLFGQRYRGEPQNKTRTKKQKNPR